MYFGRQKVAINGGERGIRTLGAVTRTPVFKTGALNQLDHLSMYSDNMYYINIKNLCQQKFVYF